ncbi:MAG: adenosine deaminase [Gemmatimonadales bacterium]
MLTRELIARLPKAELHVHLDGSLRPATMIELARGAGVSLPTGDPEALGRFMLVDDARDLQEYLNRFDYTIALLQTPDAIERVAYEIVEDAARDNVRYLEVRYCPWLSTRGGLSLEEVIVAEWRGLSRGERDFGVVARIICCSLRHHEPAKSIALAKETVRLKAHGIVGFDLAGGEAGRPPGRHAEAFAIARAGFLGVTVHAGEAAGPDSIAEAVLVCGANRLGHGTRLHEDPALEAFVRDRRILIETNITSNVQTHAVPRASAHPVRGYLDRGLAVTLSTDNWLMSGVSLTDEYWLAHRELGFTRAEIDRLLLDAMRGAFLPWPERRALLVRMRDELEGA